MYTNENLLSLLAIKHKNNLESMAIEYQEITNSLSNITNNSLKYLNDGFSYQELLKNTIISYYINLKYSPKERASYVFGMSYFQETEEYLILDKIIERKVETVDSFNELINNSLQNYKDIVENQDDKFVKNFNNKFAYKGIIDEAKIFYGFSNGFQKRKKL